MIIKRLTLHNFGVYAGTNTFEFHGTKPIVLIGGLNGRGKTTFLSGVLLALYGSSSFAVRESSYSTYGKYLRSFVNKNDGTLVSYVEMVFTTGDVDEDTYLIRRQWNAEGQRTREEIHVKKNDETSDFLAKNWGMFVENMLPSALSNFFFFDGEKIAELAVDDTDAGMKESIRSMLGMSVLDTLSSDLSRIASRISKNKTNENEMVALLNLRRNREDLEEDIIKLQQQKEEYESRLKAIEAALAEENNIYLIKGGNIINRREELLTQKAALNERFEANARQLLEMSSGVLPFAMNKDLLIKVRQEAEKEQEAKIGRLTSESIRNLLIGFSKQNERSAEFASLFQTYVEDNTPKDVESAYNLSDYALFQLQELTDTHLKESVEITIKLLEERKKITDKIKEIEGFLSVDIDETLLKEIQNKIRELEQEHSFLEGKITGLESSISTANGQLIKCATAYKEAAGKFLNILEMNDDNDRVLRYLDIAENILEEYSVRLQQNKTAVLAEMITKCYHRLASKKSLIEKITMDPGSLDLHYLNAEGEEIAKPSLSAGEKQLMVIAILWGLALCSKKKLPVIIDTPLSRLDSRHRKALITTYFPNASEQTIILSTDSEIDERYHEMMRENIGDEFTLEYHEDTKSTTIRRGYYLAGESA